MTPNRIGKATLSSPDLSPPDPRPASVRRKPLSGCHILIVEDEFLIADDIAAMLREAGADVIGLAASLPEGMRLAADTERIDAAVLNIDLNGETVFPLADELQARRVRMLFLTGYDESNIPDNYAAIPRCGKPTGPASVINELLQLLRPVAS